MIEIKTITVGSLFVKFCAGVHWSALKKPNFMYPGTWIYKKVWKFYFAMFSKLPKVGKKYQRCFVGAYSILKWWKKSEILLFEAFLTMSALVCAGLWWKRSSNFHVPQTVHKKKYEHSTLQCFQSYQKWVKSIRGALYPDTWISKKNVENSTLQRF
jgi:hypothetical protein